MRFTRAAEIKSFPGNVVPNYSVHREFARMSRGGATRETFKLLIKIGLRKSSKIKIYAGKRLRKKILRILVENYNVQGFYKETTAPMKTFVSNNETNISECNLDAVIEIAKELWRDGKKITLSSQYRLDKSSNEGLCVLTVLLRCKADMWGGGADGYQDEAKLTQHGLKPDHQGSSDLAHPQFDQGLSVAGLSIIEKVMSLGWVRVPEFRGARR